MAGAETRRERLLPVRIGGARRLLAHAQAVHGVDGDERREREGEIGVAEGQREGHLAAAAVSGDGHLCEL